ncbi:MAG: hypothetical protein M5U26_04260 [Planctomycetota bacterium]|nr:hypothetical protein [Planctomycetota bacterium]
MAALTLLSRKIDIPAGEKNYRVSDKVETPVDVDAIGIIPHAHLLAKEIKAVATLPDGTKKDLLWIDDWDFNWQGSYSYKDPVRLPKGTSVEMSFRFDNSAENANNPNNPPRRVRWGSRRPTRWRFCGCRCCRPTRRTPRS